MYCQSFTPKELFSIAKYNEKIILFDKYKDLDTVIKAIGTIVDQFKTCKIPFSFRFNSVIFINGQIKNSTEFIIQNLLIRKLYNNIKNVYHVEQSNRNNIIRQIKTLLSEDYPLWILRLDVKSFYESIKREKIINRFKDDCRLSGQSMAYMKMIYDNPLIKSSNGLPRGLSISSAMSEMYMHYIDLKVRSHPDTYYYARFVDDIIIFCSNESGQKQIMALINEEFKKLDLELNTNKTLELNESNFANGEVLTYLGYEFRISSKSKNHQHTIAVNIAALKIKHIEERLVKCFSRFIKERDYSLLKDRIKFLTGNYVIRNVDNLAPIRAGLYYNYNQVTDFEQNQTLKQLDKYYRSILLSKSPRFGLKISMLLTVEQRRQLNKYSFSFGYTHKVSHYFTPIRMGQIKACWL